MVHDDDEGGEARAARKPGKQPAPMRKPGEGEDPADPTVLPPDLDALLEIGTPPIIWEEDGPGHYHPSETANCGVRIDLPTVEFPTPRIAEIDGLDAARTVTTEIADFGTELIHAVHQTAPPGMSQLLDELFGPPPAPPGPALPPIPGLDFQLRVAEILVRLTDRLNRFPPGLAPRPAPVPQPAVPADASLRVGVDADTELVLHIYSKMRSTYTFGRGEGTSYGSSRIPGVDPRLPHRDDRPWFAKALVPRRSIPHMDGNPERPYGVGSHYIVQMGLAGEATAWQWGSGEAKSLSHGLWIQVRFNGNYGIARIVVEVPDRACTTWGDLIVEGPYEEDVVALEEARFTRAETTRDAILNDLTSLQSTLGILGSAAGTIPVVGALVDTALARVGILVEEKKFLFETRFDAANRGQQAINNALAEHYPERGPVGGAEDDPR